MTARFHVACVQMTSAREPSPNIKAASAHVRDAHDAGAQLIMLPEVVNMVEAFGPLVLERAHIEAEDPFLAAMRALARKTGVWLLVGSIILKSDRPSAETRSEDSKEILVNRSLLIDAVGVVVARYDKIHMFDVDLEDGESYRESKSYQPGAAAVVAETPWGTLGMTVCYDLRFPHLYRTLAHRGASYLAIPSAFTQTTGAAHWHVLMRARAIENGCFVFAPAQCGVHESGRKTYGHSLIVDPWGRVLADGGKVPGIISVEINPADIKNARGRIPSLTHDRLFD